MPQYQFGVGTVVGVRTDQANSQPAFFGVTQEWELDIDQKLVTLMGQYKDPVDVAPSERTVTGKIKFARLQATTWGNMLFGIAPTATSGIDMVVNEIKTTTTTTYTVAAATSFTQDLGVYYQATGIALTPIASAPTVGQYVPGAAGVGTYTINTADAGASVLGFYYEKTANDQYSMTVSQVLMGSGPTVQLNFNTPYSVNGVTKKFNLQILQARISKAPLQFKNAAYMVPEMDFTAFLNSAGNLLTWSMTE